MIINNLTLINRINALNNYSEKKLPQRISYAITKNLVVMGKEYDVYTQLLNNLLSKYNDDLKHDENGEVALDATGMPIVNEECAAAFRRELSDLLGVEIDLDAYIIDENNFDYDDNDGRYDALSPNDIRILQSILCNE